MSLTSARYVSSSTNAKETQKDRLQLCRRTPGGLTPNLTFTVGLRWEFYFPEAVNGRGQGGFADLKTGSFRVAGYGPYNTAMNVSKGLQKLCSARRRCLPGGPENCHSRRLRAKLRHRSFRNPFRSRGDPEPPGACQSKPDQLRAPILPLSISLNGPAAVCLSRDSLQTA